MQEPLGSLGSWGGCLLGFYEDFGRKLGLPRTSRQQTVPIVLLRRRSQVGRQLLPRRMYRTWLPPCSSSKVSIESGQGPFTWLSPIAEATSSNCVMGGREWLAIIEYGQRERHRVASQVDS